jgi:hypothetical protein
MSGRCSSPCCAASRSVRCFAQIEKRLRGDSRGLQLPLLLPLAATAASAPVTAGESAPLLLPIVFTCCVLLLLSL